MDEDLQEILAKVAQDAVDAYLESHYKNKHVRKVEREAENPDLRLRRLAQQERWRKDKRKNDPIFREKERLYSQRNNLKRKETGKDKEYEARRRERYHSDPEYRQRRLQQNREYAARKKAEKEALNNDND